MAVPESLKIMGSIPIRSILWVDCVVGTRQTVLGGNLGIMSQSSKEYHRDWYHRNKDRIREDKRAAQVKWRSKRLELIQELKSKPCTDCGMNYPHYVMDFDHLFNKSFNISDRRYKVNTEELVAEIAKCEVVCANCHRERTYKRLGNRDC